MLQTICRAEALARADSAALLKALMSGGEYASIDSALQAAGNEMDDAGDLGLTIGVDQVVLLANPAGLRGRSELYFVTAAIDGSLNSCEDRTGFFPGVKPGAALSLGDGGMLLGCFANPRWFIDIHMLVMASNGGPRHLGEKIQTGRQQAQLDRLLQAADRSDRFDPGLVAQVVNGVDIFLDALAGLLSAEGDDHVATVHDFYLKHQAFGKGRHPAEGRKRFQGVELAYEIQLTPITAD